MQRSAYKIHIIGAGVSGLIAAKTLEENGYNPIIIEATGEVGGRVKTDVVEGYQLDHGFQVLLNAYPKAKEHLDFDQLNLQQLLPGAKIYTKQKTQIIGDPLRNLQLLLPTLFSNIGSFSDKLKILRLNRRLKQTQLSQIFKNKHETTLEYLQQEGFSEAIIQKFFRPFFSGIFLEPDLRTSSRMFEFVYKMFGEGLAVLPKAGIGEISKQLKSQLKKTEFHFNKRISEVKDNHIVLDDGTIIETHFTIIATTAHNLVSNLKNQTLNWKSCYNLYFEVNKSDVSKPIIGLIADDNMLINNIFYCNSIAQNTTGNHQLLSVTVVKNPNCSEDELINKVQEELKSFCNIETKSFLRLYKIPQALPDIDNPQYDLSPTETQLKPTIYLAGDHLLNGSLNAAMIAGERAAQGVILSLEDGLVIDKISSEYI